MSYQKNQPICLGIYRSHEGTVYSLDAYWKSGHPPEYYSKKNKTGGNRNVHPIEEGSSAITLITGSHDHSILVWDVNTEVDPKTKELDARVIQINKIAAHAGDVYCLSLVPNIQNKEKAAFDMLSGGDYTVKLWNSQSGKQVYVFHGHTGYVACLKSSNKRAFSGSWDTTIRSWNLENQKPMHVFKGHKNIVNCLEITETDIFSGSWDMTVRQWSRATGDCVNVYAGHTDGVQCISYYSDSLFSGSMDKTIRMWNVKTAKTIRIFKGHNGGVECIAVEKRLCFSGSYDKSIRCFNIDNGDCLSIFGGHTDGIYCLKVFEGILFSGSGDKSVRLWDIRALIQAHSERKWWQRFLCC